MRVEGLLIPDLLQDALDAGKWPRTANEALKQNLRSLVSEERIRQVAPDESKIYLYAPPFATLARALVGGDFYVRFGALDQLVPELAIAIADFGMGSDSPILLDYQHDRTTPSVIRLWWPGGGSPNRWVMIAPDFKSFVESLGL